MELGDRDTASPKGVYTEIGIQCELGDSTLARLLKGPDKEKETVVDDKTPLLGESKQSVGWKPIWSRKMRNGKISFKKKSKSIYDEKCLRLWAVMIFLDQIL